MNRTPTLIIIIDDEEDLCFLLSKMLRAQGFEVESYPTLAAGMKAIEANPPDWVILDNNLPDGLGWKQSEHILKTSDHLQLINISANPDSERVSGNPRVHYLIKPIDATSIVEVMQSN
jgi:DNA-binding response OmpR family regulator